MYTIVNVIISLLCSVILSLVHAGAACLLWNWIVVGVFTAPILTYWQMLGIIWLIKFILPNTIQFGEDEE